MKNVWHRITVQISCFTFTVQKRSNTVVLPYSGFGLLRPSWRRPAADLEFAEFWHFYNFEFSALGGNLCDATLGVERPWFFRSQTFLIRSSVATMCFFAVYLPTLRERGILINCENSWFDGHFFYCFLLGVVLWIHQIIFFASADAVVRGQRIFELGPNFNSCA